ncbi:hypothetical protein OF83DRAFT_1178624 [Amylostereum chailletii]|nr:hypothetical protein OF83DRAFT_1178624 [Amylostereum chailletii]
MENEKATLLEFPVDSLVDQANVDKCPPDQAGSGAGRGSDAYADMDEEILALTRALHAAKRRRNNATPCHKLPPEVFSNILLYLANMCPLNVGIHPWGKLAGAFYGYKGDDKTWAEPPNRKIVNRLAWINALHACQYFREVGLNDTRLWTVIKLGQLAECMPDQWTPIFFSRSKSALLDVSAVFSEEGRIPVSAFEKAMEDPAYARRVRTLFMSQIRPNAHTAYDEFLLEESFYSPNHNMEALQSLRVEWRTVTDPLPFRDDFEAPNLSKLCIRGAIPSPYLPVYANLLHLELELFGSSR